MMTASQEELQQRVAAWIEDLGDSARAAAMLAEQGEAVIPALRAYLCREPQVIPQPRCFAVAMLARLHADAATEGLRQVLHLHPLRTLEPRVAESEYVVKSDALAALAARAYPHLKMDIAFAVAERLRVGVEAAGRFGLLELAPELAALLNDDVLADTAAEALTRLGPPASTAILEHLDAWLTEALLSIRQRLAVVRGLRVLHRLHVAVDQAPTIRRALEDPHPVVRAAASLLVGSQRRDETLIENLLHGALGFDWELAQACRDALEHADARLAAAASRALQRNAEIDLYGKQQALSTEQRRWLKARLRRASNKE